MSKILVICPIGLGNFIMATPALAGLDKYSTKQDLHLLALKPGIREMGQACGWFSTVHFWDPDKEPLFTGITLLLKLRSEKFDISLCLFPTGHWKFALFAAFAMTVPYYLVARFIGPEFPSIFGG